LSSEDKEIWDLYSLLRTQFVYDFNALPLIFEIFGLKQTKRQAWDTITKLIMIHQMFSAKQSLDNPMAPGQRTTPKRTPGPGPRKVVLRHGKK